MHYLNESHMLLFLVQVLVILGCARTLSVICETYNIPAIAGEIMTWGSKLQTALTVTILISIPILTVIGAI